MTKPAKKSRPTVTFRELRRMTVCGSPNLPEFVEADGVRKHWVGFGWVDHGPALGNEVLVVEE